MKIPYFLFVLVASSVGCGETASNLQDDSRGSYPMSSRVLANEELPLLWHTDSGPYGSYLAMSIQYQPVATIHQAIETREGLRLLDRGEAHVTVVTPPEYDRILKAHLPINRVHEIALDYGIQGSELEVRCLGLGELGVSENTLRTYFIVVKSEPLLEIRKLIRDEYEAAGGAVAMFDHEDFYPHITVGFTHRDLHIADGIHKDEASCVAPIELVD